MTPLFVIENDVLHQYMWIIPWLLCWKLIVFILNVTSRHTGRSKEPCNNTVGSLFRQMVISNLRRWNLFAGWTLFRAIGVWAGPSECIQRAWYKQSGLGNTYYLVAGAGWQRLNKRFHGSAWSRDAQGPGSRCWSVLSFCARLLMELKEKSPHGLS